MITISFLNYFYSIITLLLNNLQFSNFYKFTINKKIKNPHQYISIMVKILLLDIIYKDFLLTGSLIKISSLSPCKTASASPPICSAKSFTIDKPNPVPELFLALSPV